MLFSASYCAIWIARIVPLMSRQSILGVLDEISVIPPGRVFVYLTVCKVVLNQDDAVLWLGLLRRVLAGLVTIVLLMSLCIALTLLADQFDPGLGCDPARPCARGCSDMAGALAVDSARLLDRH